MLVSCSTEWSGSIGLGDRLSMIRQAGFHAADVVLSSPGETQELSLLSTPGALPTSGLTVRDEQEDAVPGLTSVVRRLGLSSLTLVVGPRRRQTLAGLADRLERFLAALGGLRLELVNRAGSRLEQLGDFRELFIRLDDPRLRLVIDTVEFHRASVNPRQAIDEMGDRLARLILADAVGRERVPLEAGEINVRAVLEAARRNRYSGWVVLAAPDSSREPTVAQLAAERQRLESILGLRPAR